MRIHAALFVLAAAGAQDVPRPTRLRIYEVRTSLRFDEGELQRVNFRYDRSSGIKSDIARSLVDVGLTTDRGFVFEVAFFGTDVFLRINGYFLDVNDDQAYQFLMKKFDTKACDYDNLLTWIRESIKRR